MLGLIFAALYVAFAIVANDTPPVAAVESTLGFLWYWHAVFVGLCGIILMIVPLVGLIAAIAGDGKEKALGVGMLLGSPILFFLGMLMPMLFLGAVYSIDSGIQGGEIVNQSHVIVGTILYSAAILSQMSCRFYKSSS